MSVVASSKLQDVNLQSNMTLRNITAEILAFAQRPGTKKEICDLVSNQMPVIFKPCKHRNLQQNYNFSPLFTLHIGEFTEGFSHFLQILYIPEILGQIKHLLWLFPLNRPCTFGKCANQLLIGNKPREAFLKDLTH